jgi:hypothetical protein
MIYDVCSDCSEVQCAEVVFGAMYPITKRMFTIQYCKHLDLILTDDIKHAIGKVSCGFEQKARDAKLYG